MKPPTWWSKVLAAALIRLMVSMHCYASRGGRPLPSSAAPPRLRCSRGAPGCRCMQAEMTAAAAVVTDAPSPAAPTTTRPAKGPLPSHDAPALSKAAALPSARASCGTLSRTLHVQHAVDLARRRRHRDTVTESAGQKECHQPGNVGGGGVMLQCSCHCHGLLLPLLRSTLSSQCCRCRSAGRSTRCTATTASAVWSCAPTAPAPTSPNSARSGRTHSIRQARLVAPCPYEHVHCGTRAHCGRRG